MKRYALRALSAVLSAALLLPAAAAHGQDGGGRGRLYDVDRVETLRGVVAGIEVMPRSAPRGGVHLMLRTQDEEIEVHVGPLWYLDRVGFVITLGDELEVRGSRVLVQGRPAIIAAQVTIGDRTLPLRNEAGIPLWAGFGGRVGAGPGPWR